MTLRPSVSAAACLAAALLAAPATAASGFALDAFGLPSDTKVRSSPTVEQSAAEMLGVSQVDRFVPIVSNLDSGGMEITVPLDGVLRTLTVHPHSIRTDDFMLRAQIPGGEIVDIEPMPSRLFKGMLDGESGSGVVGSSMDDGLHISVLDADGSRWWIEPIAGRVAGAGGGDHVVYRNDSILPTGATCGFAADVGVALGAEMPVVQPGLALGSAPVLCVTELANDADVEYFNDYGSVDAVNDRIELVVATVNLQYESEVGITHVITDTLVRTAEPDPYTVNTNTELLCQFINEWTNNQQLIQRDVAHLWTGKEISGSVIGQAAALGSICEPQGCTSFPCNCGPFGTAGSYCFSQSDFNNNFASATDLTAHELGHLWNASHCTCPSHTMNPSITSSNSFNPTFTRPTIEAYRDSRPCLDCLDAVVFTFPNGQPDLLDPAGGTTVRVEVSDGLSSPQPGTGLLHIDTGSGFTAIAMNEVSPNVYDAVFPAIDCPTEVAYFFSVEVPAFGQVTVPANAPLSSFSVFAATSVAVAFEDDFELPNGWTVQNGPGLTDGAWTRGIPVGGGDRGDPADDGDGSGRCYLTDNVDGNSDVDGGATTLVSPILDASAGGETLTYLRWFDNTFGAAPGADVFTVEYSTNGGGSWTILEVVGPGGPEASGGWFSASFALADLGIAPTDQFRVRFTAEDAGEGSVIEAAVDGVRLIAAGCEVETPCPADVSGDGAVGFDDLVSVLAAFGSCAGCPEDIVPNGEVDFEDLLALLAAWGPCP